MIHRSDPFSHLTSDNSRIRDRMTCLTNIFIRKSKVTLAESHDSSTVSHSWSNIAPKNYRMCWLLLVWYLNCKLGNFLRHKLRALHLPIQIICVQQPYTLFSRAGTNTPSDEYDMYRDTGWRIRYVSRIHFFSEAKLGNG